jgi:hypothetical protein
MVIRRDELAPGTLVYLTGGTHEGCVGRVSQYTPKRVRDSLLENAQGILLDRDRPGPSVLTDYHFVIRMLSTHPRARPYPELVLPESPPHHHPTPLRRAVVELVVAHALDSSNVDLKLEALIADIRTGLQIHGGRTPYTDVVWGVKVERRFEEKHGREGAGKVSDAVRDLRIFGHRPISSQLDSATES